MLVLSRGLKETITIQTPDGVIFINVMAIRSGTDGGKARVEIGIDAPEGMKIGRVNEGATAEATAGLQSPPPASSFTGRRRD